MVQLRRLVVAAFLAFMAVMWVGGAWLSRAEPLMLACCVVFASGYVLATTAIVRRWFWARWLALGIAIVGALNTAVFLGLGYMSRDPLLVIQGCGFPVMFTLLLGDGMRARYELAGSRHNAWDFTRPGMHRLSWAVVLGIATAPMLLMLGCSPQTGLSLATRAGAIATAAVLALGVVQVIRCRAAGLVLLAAAGLATLALGAVVLPVALSHDAARVYATAIPLAAFPPGIAGALLSIALFARPIARFLRR